jgi:tetraacyldisaccharide 4'-kinase
MKKNKLFSFWQKKERSGILLLFLQFLSLLYLLGYVIRKAFYRLSIIKVKELRAKVISVGNITLGGSGKTPFVLYLAHKLKERGFNFAILTRGYGRKKKIVKELRLIETPDIRWEEVGDEPLLLSQHLSEITVLIDKDRYGSGKIAIDKYKANVLILDDGFQHWRLKRDIDILMIDCTQNLDKEMLFPSGRLREPLSSLKRAGIFILTRADQSPYAEKLKAVLRKYNRQAPIVETILEVTSVINWKDKTEIDLESLKGKKAVIFCGIGNPHSFEITLKSLEIEIKNAFFFVDHYIYTRKNLLSLDEKGKELGADFLITTEKDSIRLPQINDLKNPLLVVNIELRITSGEEKLWEVLNI